MDNAAFRKNAHELADWMADYLDGMEKYPVKPTIRPGDIKQLLPQEAPPSGESFTEIFSDFQKIIIPGMTHWQHPQFFAYFPTGASEPSILAEMLTATLGAQCMIWQTSPAAEELEERMMEWLREMKGLPSHFTGVIQDSSSSSTLVAMLTAREKKTNFAINARGFSKLDKFRIYTSTQAHSSVDKAVKIAGFGIDNLVKVAVDTDFAMETDALENAIQQDIASGYVPLCVVATIGTTSSTAIDPIEKIGLICKKYGCWLHIDASYAGTALLLPEMRWMGEGTELADSYVFNPHKWMFTNFDCSAYFVADKASLIKTFSILPEYLKTPEDQLVNNYRDWGIPLGRRFRALKLWFVIRTYGISGLQEKIREHLAFANWLKNRIALHPSFEIMAPVPLNLVCFRWKPTGIEEEAQLDKLNQQLLERLNASGKILLTQTRLNDRYVIRFVAGQTHTRLEHVMKGWQIITNEAQELAKSLS
ncbi:MAG: aminotransferase class I/II-fold pyridoxal phosphate-dependent enzyme [Chitinophagaceae bacterium]|nr:aminotransferase class I/II-fold pyridoxal phosphate-dependent enzyme [Chitinophagaceae bacterium]